MKWKILLLIFTIPLFGEEIGTRISALEAQMGEIRTETAQKNYGARFADDSFEKGIFGVEFFGSLLYWHAKLGGTEYAYAFANQKLNRKSKETKEQNFDWNFGYRLGIGVRLPVVSWEIFGTYTHYGSQNNEKNENLPPSFFARGQTAPTKSSSKIDYDTVILELKKSSFFSRMLGIGTTIGVKKTWVDQREEITYHLNKHDILKVKDQCTFQGVGPRIGLSGRWYLFAGFSFLTDIAFSLLYGEFDVKHAEASLDLKGSAHLFSPALDFFFGLHWDHPLDWAQLSLRLGYEADYLWREHQAVKLEDTTSAKRPFRVTFSRNADDLTFYGMTLRGGVEF